MGETNPNPVADGGPLRVLANGLTIIRRQKHEFDPRILTMPSDQLRLRTGKTWGSKFSERWDTLRLTGWIEEQVNQAGWRLAPATRQTIDIRVDEVVGLVGGEQVHTIRVVTDGRYVHAYPVKDRP